MRAVFDLDDTICIHKNRDYPNAEPIIPVIEKMRKMKQDGWEIVIYSARGQVSCNGNLKEIEKKNRKVVEEWLSKHDVPCDELLFGKPLGDLYVDDKGVSLKDFLEQPFYLLHGGSGKAVYRQGNLVRKEFGTAEETNEYKRWIEENNGEFAFPKVYSFVYNTCYMEFIDGARGCDVDAAFVPDLLKSVISCKNTSPQRFSIEPHIKRMKANQTGQEKADALLEKVARFLDAEKECLKSHGSFCHGDLTLSNIILSDNNLYFVDARNTTGANSYLLDLAKLRMSLNGYENIFGISNVDNSKWCRALDAAAETIGVLDYVIAMEIMFIFRCYRYKNDDEKEKVIQFALREGEGWL